MTTPEVPSNFYNTNPLLNPDIYHTNNVPYQNLPNGQYAQSHMNSRCLTTISTVSRGLETAAKPAFNTEQMEMAQNQDLNNSSSDSDDSNNDSDSSSGTDAEKEDRENSSKRVVKPFRLNLNKVDRLLFYQSN